MSTWIVDKVHIDLLVTAALAWELVVEEKADETGRLLWQECQRSVAHRYPRDKDGEWPGPWFPDLDRGLTLVDIERYVFEPLEGRVDPQVVEIATSSYQYQSCEHPEWEGSEAFRLSNALREAAEQILPGYQQRWGRIDRDHVAHYLDGGAWAVGSRTMFLAAENLRAASRARA
jgi:hypothetical protein